MCHFPKENYLLWILLYKSKNENAKIIWINFDFFKYTIIWVNLFRSWICVEAYSYRHWRNIYFHKDNGDILKLLILTIKKKTEEVIDKPIKILCDIKHFVFKNIIFYTTCVIYEVNHGYQKVLLCM